MIFFLRSFNNCLVSWSKTGPTFIPWATELLIRACLSKSKVIQNQLCQTETSKICVDSFSVSLDPGAQGSKEVKMPTSIYPNVINMISQEAFACIICALREKSLGFRLINMQESNFAAFAHCEYKREKRILAPRLHPYALPVPSGVFFCFVETP